MRLINRKLLVPPSGGETLVYSSDFSSDADSWGASQGTVDGNIDGIGGQDDWLRFTTNTATGVRHATGWPSAAFQFTIGVTYRVEFDIIIPSSNSNILGMKFVSWPGIAYEVTTLDTVVSVNQSFTAGAAFNQFRATNGAGNEFVNDAGGDDVFYLKNVKSWEEAP